MTTVQKPAENGNGNGPQNIFTEVFGVSKKFGVSLLAAAGAALLFGLYWCFHSAPPRTVFMTSGPEGSMFDRTGDKYAEILKREGITLKVVTSEGSADNLKRLFDPKFTVDVGFVLSESTNAVTGNIMSLGTVFNQPLMIFYRGARSLSILSDFKGKRLAVGETGSGTQTLALTLLAANGIKPGGPTRLLEIDSGKAGRELLEGSIDAVFLMGDSATPETMIKLLHAPGVHLFSFTQADAYTRKFAYLNKMDLPRGGIDFGNDLPREDKILLGLPVELVARKSLHPAISDALLEAAHELHSKPGLFKHAGEFPAPQEHAIALSPSAVRFYKSGKSFFYRYLPFILASLVDRVVVVFLPLVVVLVPIVKFLIWVYRLRVTLSINRWYRRLLIIEQEVITGADAGRRRELLGQMDRIEDRVNKMRVPASFAGQFYELRGHVGFVRGQITK